VKEGATGAVSSREGGRPLSAPAYTLSRYVQTASTTVHYDLGCDRANRRVYGALVLLYGMPLLVDGKQGASLYSGPDSTTTTIAKAAKQFVKGFYECSVAGASLRVAFGTSNYGSKVTYTHGSAWAGMVNDIAAYADSNGYSSRVFVRAGSDMEPSWNGPITTRAWVDGYESTHTKWLYDAGSADGCPQTGDGTKDGTCNNGWKQSDVLYVSWGSPPAVPFPEIYATSGANAKQWQKVKLYGVVSEGETMGIVGSLTQWNACQEMGGCNGTDNQPAVGWQQLYDQLNSDSRTAQDLAYSSDMSWER
jgi:hypothetical protein